MSRLVLVVLLALCVSATTLANKDTRESLDDSEIPPQEFPNNKALKFDATKLPTPKTPLEVPDLNKENDTEPVKHPKVSDPGTTHAEEGSRGSIHACALPNLHEANSSASNWLADNGNVTKVCHLTLKWLHGASSGTLRVCTIPHDAWNASYTVTDGTIPKEVFAELNTSSVKCVTPSEALSNGSSVAAANGSLPSAWLRSNDTIYIYIIPQEWLKIQPPSEKASEVEDLTKDTLDVVSSTPNSIESTSSSTSAAGSSVTPSSAEVISTTTASSVVVGFNNTEAKNVTEKTVTLIDNSTAASLPSNITLTTVVTPTAKNTETNVSSSSTTLPPAVVPGVSVNTTEKPKKVTSESPKESTATKPTEKPKENPTKSTEKPKEDVIKTTEKPAVTVTTVAPKKTEETTTKKENETTEKPKDIAPPEEHFNKDNEIGHRDSSPQPPEALSQQHSEHNHATTGKTAFLQPTESAAILAGVFVAIALLGYAGLLLWRRVLEKRYGNREMLVNEDDDFDTSDMRHFEL